MLLLLRWKTCSSLCCTDKRLNVAYSNGTSCFRAAVFSSLGKLSLLGLVMGLLLGACTPSAPRESDKPRVVSTSTILTDLTQEVGGDEIELTGILPPGSDPHVYEPVPADTVAFERADLILYNGFNLEPGLIRMMNAAGLRAEKLAVGEVVTPLQLEKEGVRVPDPHVWGDVRNAIAMTRAIQAGLTRVAPEDQAEFARNADALVRELEALHAWIQQQIATIPPAQRRLITTHDAFQYFANAYGLEVMGTLIGISTEEQPSAQRVQKLVEAVKSARVPAIFAETTINPRLITTVAEEAGVKLAPKPLYSDSIGAPGSNAATYVDMMVANTTTIVEALGGQVTPFVPPR